MNKHVTIEFDIEMYAWDNSGTVEKLEKGLVEIISNHIPRTLPGHVTGMAVAVVDKVTKPLFTEGEVVAHYEYPDET
jgi:hypothetical protein